MRGLIAAGVPVANFTIGDFDSKMFPVPEVLVERTEAHLKAGQTHYPPAIGVAELRTAIEPLPRPPRPRLPRRHGPRAQVPACRSSRPSPRSWRRATRCCTLQAMERWLLCVPQRGRRRTAGDAAENGFMPTLEDLLPHLKTARVLLLNSSLNPCGTVMDPALLKPVCEAIVEENSRREAAVSVR